MDSLNRHLVEQRIARVVDASVAANADAKGMKEHLGALRKAVGLADPSQLDDGAFKRRFGKGI